MPDKITKEQRSRNMSKIKSKNTKPELILRKALWKEGLRYRLHYGKEKIDIAFRGRKVAVFVDGCFWHKCPKHYKEPKSNKDYWIPKIERNVERDLEKDRRLKKLGWKVIHVWEHELKDLSEVLKKVTKDIFEFDKLR